MMKEYLRFVGLFIFAYSVMSFFKGSITLLGITLTVIFASTTFFLVGYPKIAMWFIAINIVSLLPLIIGLLSEFDHTKTLSQNVSVKTLNMICDKSIYQILLAIFFSGWIDFCYGRGFKMGDIYIHYICFLVVSILIELALVGDICFDSKELYTIKFTVNGIFHSSYKVKQLFFVLCLPTIISCLSIYLKEMSESAI